MAGLVEALRGRRIFAEFPERDQLPDWLVAGEVLIQEGVRAWAFPAGDLERLAEALKMFGRRARIGVAGARTPEQVAAAAQAGAHFVTAPTTSHELLAAAGGVPFAPGALTPNEVQYALGLGAASVNVIPAEALGMAYARSLGTIFPEAELVATGRLERFQCEMWFDAGAAVVGLQSGVLFPDPVRYGEVPTLDADAFRRRAQDYGALG